MAGESHTMAVRVSADRLSRLAAAVLRTDFSYYGHHVWFEHLLGEHQEVDITNLAVDEPEALPAWIRASPYLAERSELRNGCVWLLRGRARARHQESGSRWALVQSCHLAQPGSQEAEAAAAAAASGLLLQEPPLPRGLRQMLRAGELLELAGCSRGLIFLLHDLIAQEEQVVRQSPLFFLMPTVSMSLRVDVRRCTLLSGRVCLDSAVATYTNRQEFREDLARAAPQGDGGGGLLCGAMREPLERGAEAHWPLRRALAETPENMLEINEEEQQDALRRLAEAPYWEGENTVCVRLEFMCPSADLDDIVEARGGDFSTRDALVDQVPRSCRLRGRSSHEPDIDDGQPRFCRFFGLPAEQVASFAEGLPSPHEGNEGSATLAQLRRLATTAAERGQALFFQQTCA